MMGASENSRQETEQGGDGNPSDVHKHEELDAKKEK